MAPTASESAHHSDRDPQHGEDRKEGISDEVPCRHPITSKERNRFQYLDRRDGPPNGPGEEQPRARGERCRGEHAGNKRYERTSGLNETDPDVEESDRPLLNRAAPQASQVLAGNLASPRHPSGALPHCGGGIGRLLVVDAHVVKPLDGLSCQCEPDTQVLILGESFSEATDRIERGIGERHPGAAQVGRPAKIRTRKLDHSVPRPIRHCIGHGDRGATGIGRIEVDLHDRVSGRDLIADSFEQIGRHTIVGVDDEHDFSRCERLEVQVPRERRSLPLAAAIALDHAGGRCLRSRGVAAAIGDHDHIGGSGGMRLQHEVPHQVADHRLLVVRRHDDPYCTRRRCGRGRSIPPPPEGRDRVVARERRHENLWNGGEEPYHDGAQRTSNWPQAGPIVTSLPDRSVAIVLGTRPEIIKLAGTVHLLGDAARVIYTGQHYDPELSGIFFDEFGMARPDVHVGIGAERRGTQIGRATAGLDELFAEDRPLAVVVQGDTNTVAAGALAANAADIPLVHVEAGLRSFDRRMPEEHNRVIADHLSDRCLAATETGRRNLLAEQIGDDRIVVTGNTIVEAVERLMPRPDDRKTILSHFGVERDQFVLSTLHRPENTDDPANLRLILSELADLSVPVVLPLHPRTVRRIEEFDMGEALSRIMVVDPIGYRDFLALGAEAALLVSDSGGVQEEVSVYKRPLIVVRRSTERPEVIGTFADLVEPGPEIGTTANRWLDDLDQVHGRLEQLASPYGDATAPQQTVNAIVEVIDA